jgi:hypothetical protein
LAIFESYGAKPITAHADDVHAANNILRARRRRGERENTGEEEKPEDR